MNDGPLPSQDRPDPNDPPAHLRARVPDRVSDGVFSNGVIVMTGPSEFVLDFLQTVGRPHRIAARVVLPHPVMPQFIDALKKNLELYEQRFGALPTAAPAGGAEGSTSRRPTPQEIYDDLKLGDSMLSGAYANGVMIGHGAAEFSLDFLTSFFPQSAVSARVYLAAGQMPRLLESMQAAYQGLRDRGKEASSGRGPATPEADPGKAPDASGDSNEPESGRDDEGPNDDQEGSGGDDEPGSGGKS